MRLRLNNKKEISIELFYLIVIAVSFILELIFCEFQFQRILNLLENILFAIIVIIPINFIKNKTLSNFYFTMSFFFFNLLLLVETSYYYVFNVNLSPSAIYIFFETNNVEAKEFLTFYIDNYLIGYIFITLLIFLLIVSIRYKNIKYLSVKLIGIKKLILALLFIIVVLEITPLKHQNLPFLILKSYYVVFYESGVLNTGVYKDEKGIFTEARTNNSRNNKLFFVVIGESTTSNNMSIYGYKRNTNPLLGKQRELNVFNDVISPHAGTTASLTKALSMENYEGFSKKASIMQLLNAANYDTYWVSNQQPVGFAETEITKLIYACKNKTYLNTEGTEEFNQYDEVVFKEIDNIINDKSNKNKVVFVHLQGTHFYYENKYPKTFDVFKDNPNSPFAKLESEYKIINEYDNAVRYNDYIINGIINKIKNVHAESFVLYLSDHGEEVYHTIKFAGHNDDVGTVPMFQIPFVFWQSEKYKTHNNIEIDLKRPYMTDDLFHSIADLCGISDANVDLQRSIFSENFINRKRIILNNKDYDSILNIKDNRN